MKRETTAMTRKSRSWRAQADDAQTPAPLHGLVELLLDLLLSETRSGRSAQLTVRSSGNPAPGEGEAMRFARVGEPSDEGRVVSTSAALPDGGTIMLTVRADLLDDAPTQARLQRFILPMVTCLSLDHQLDELTVAAREAVAEVESREVLDLATGVLMAQRDCDSVTARRLLTAWSKRTGIDIGSLTAAGIIELMTAEDGPAYDPDDEGPPGPG
jgi:hypothetical protein